jgi:hypothetical protein
MMKLNELIGQPLKWVQPRAFKLKYELHDGGRVIATLDYPRFFDTFAIAECADGNWTFQGGDFRQPTVCVREFGADIDLAVLKKNMWTGAGTLKLPNGRKYQASVSGYKASEYDFNTETGERLISCRNIWGPLHASADVQFYRQAKALAELPWIVMLVWHLALVL